jgi:hypothetical protein
MYFSLENNNEFDIIINGNYNSFKRNNFQINLMDKFINWESGERLHKYNWTFKHYREYAELIQKYFLLNFNDYIIKSSEYFETEVMFNMKNIFPYYIQVIIKKIENNFKNLDIKTHIYQNDAFYIKLFSITTKDLKSFLDYIKKQFLEENFNRNMIEYIKEHKIIYNWFKEELNNDILKEINYLLQAKNFDLI